ncbi:MAG: ChaN family lipoprotein [Gammaproteobacteria bacterium]
MKPSPLWRACLAAVLGLFITAQAVCAEPTPPQVVDARQQVSDLDALISAIVDKRVVFVGETHDRYDHHLNQLAIIQRLHERDARWAIGMEQFQQPFQPYLDAYSAGELDERGLLEKTEYFKRWGFDYRLYRPILRYARDHHIALVALNATREITDLVSTKGFAGLSAAERAQLPAVIDTSDEAYHARLREVYEHHPESANGDFERFWETQLTWDESMAERAARYLQENPERKLIVLAGSGHLAYRAGIPNRLTQRLPAEVAVLLPAKKIALTAPMPITGCYRRMRRCHTGRLGVLLDLNTGVNTQSLLQEAPAAAIGIVGDRIVAISEKPVGLLTGCAYRSSIARRANA